MAERCARVPVPGPAAASVWRVCRGRSANRAADRTRPARRGAVCSPKCSRGGVDEAGEREMHVYVADLRICVLDHYMLRARADKLARNWICSTDHGRVVA